MPLHDKTEGAAARRGRPGPTRTTHVIQRLAAEIAGSGLAPGARLPTEHALMQSLGVSRTVVREAVAALKADGLVVTRRGAGAFVAADGAAVPFRITAQGLGSIAEVVELMELRLAVEVGAAGMAAERATPAAIRAIDRALAAFARAIGAGGSAVAEDLAFHRAVADATGNGYFREFLGFLGRHVIPRQSVRQMHASRRAQAAYLARIQSEHAAIAAAIAGGEPRLARRAMRRHLTNSLSRYRRLAEAAETGRPL